MYIFIILVKLQVFAWSFMANSFQGWASFLFFLVDLVKLRLMVRLSFTLNDNEAKKILFQ